MWYKQRVHQITQRNQLQSWAGLITRCSHSKQRSAQWGDSKFMKGRSPLHMQTSCRTHVSPSSQPGCQAFDNAATCCCPALREAAGVPHSPVSWRGPLSRAACGSPSSAPSPGLSPSLQGCRIGSARRRCCSCPQLPPDVSVQVKTRYTCGADVARIH